MENSNNNKINSIEVDEVEQIHGKVFNTSFAYLKRMV